MVHATPLYAPHPSNNYPPRATVYALSAPVKGRHFAVAWRANDGWFADVCASLGERYTNDWPAAGGASDTAALAALGCRLAPTTTQLEFAFDA